MSHDQGEERAIVNDRENVAHLNAMGTEEIKTEDFGGTVNT